VSERLAAISVDLDEIPCYTRIHGLEPPTEESSRAIYRNAVPRFERLFERLGIRATFFAVGRDLDDEENRKSIKQLYEQGHEIANHSANHLYDLTRRDRDTIKREIREGVRVIKKITGENPSGFRAPGYTITDTIFEELDEIGTQYDSSVFPCPVYYTAKALAIAAIRLSGSRSHSITDTPFALTCPTEPYRVGVPYWRRGQGLLELPIGLTPSISGRIPFIGTTLVLAGKRGSALLAGLMRAKRFINLELHGIDLADADQDGLGFLKKQQIDLRRPWRDKQEALLSAIEVLRKANYRFVTLAQAADEIVG
jgi:hypothetical protein